MSVLIAVKEAFVSDVFTPYRDKVKVVGTKTTVHMQLAVVKAF